jgi:hypothetical protein
MELNNPKIPEIVVVVALLLVSLAAIAQAEGSVPAPEEAWSRTFGGSNNDTALSVQQTVDGGYIVAGGTKSYGAGEEDLWLIKTDADGNEAWSKTFGGSSSDEARSVQQTDDGSYIVAGFTYSYSAGKDDFWLIKTIAPAAVAERAINEVQSVISHENAKGLNVADAETLLSRAEQAFNTGDYTRARELAAHAKAHALDVDNDGTPNDADFAPSIKNEYIYGIAAAFLLLVAAILIVKRVKVKEVRKIREYKAKLEQWEREGYDPAKLKERWFK